MSRKHVFLSLGLVLAGLVFAACQSAATATPAASGTLVVASDDGRAQLTIPPGAWPQGVSPADVHITKLTLNHTPVISGTEAPLVSYRLEPDGLVWQQPITFTLVITSQVQSLPLLWQVSKGKAEVLSSVQVDMDLAGNKTVISVPVSHFSWITAASGFFIVDMTDPGTKSVRETFEVILEVHPLGGKGHVITGLDDNGNVIIPTSNGQPGPPLARYVRMTSNIFSVLLGKYTATQPIVSPGEIVDAPTKWTNSAFIDIRTFQCVQAGTASIAHAAYIEYQQENDTFPLPVGAKTDYVPPDSALTKVPEKTGTTKTAYTITTGVKCVTTTPTLTLAPTTAPPKPPSPAPTKSPTPCRNSQPTQMLCTPTPTATPSSTTPAARPPTRSPTPTPSPTPNLLPIVQSFVSTFVQVERTTHYRVAAVDPSNSGLKYAWTKAQPPGLECGLFGPTDQAETAWQHADAPLGNCPNEPVHMATITVVVSNANGFVTCEYKGGSASGSIVQCVNSR